MVDDKDRDIETVLAQFLINRNNITSLRIVAFLTRGFMSQLMTAVKQRNCPLKHLYVRAYSFQTDQNFVSKSALKREFEDVIESLETYDLISYSRNEDLRSANGYPDRIIQNAMQLFLIHNL
jgi:hypothetical protein